MNVTELSEQLARQAEQMDSYPAVLLPAARRHARLMRIRRATAAALGVTALASGAIAVVPHVLPGTDPLPAAGVSQADSSGADAVASRPVGGVIRDGEAVSLSEGVTFEIMSDGWTLMDPSGHRSVDSIFTRADGRHGLAMGVLPGRRFHTMDIFPGTASKVVYTVKLPGYPARTYEADVYRLDRVPNFTLAYVAYPVGDFVVTTENERAIDITFEAWDSAGRPVATP